MKSVHQLIFSIFSAILYCGFGQDIGKMMTKFVQMTVGTTGPDLNLINAARACVRHANRNCEGFDISEAGNFLLRLGI